MDHETCVSCGFDGAHYDGPALIGSVRKLGSSWRTLIAECGGALRVRPQPGVWSAIEYAAHSRDVTALHAFGVEQALTTEEPVFPAINGEDLIQSASASYGDEDPDEVVNSLDRESARLAQLAEDAGSQTWRRGLTIGGTRMDVRRLLEHALHDSLHHLGDVARGLSMIPPGAHSTPPWT